ncbi:hypothetical protein GCM10012275_34360 [Longimycelium tulufanense]|uniref:ABC transporter domain-containing protein n=1 Tax=Longimycelium tulufanense TaxID=907463 RepID=A0A8J3CDZ6_9PSEU|nr:hypothetical protein GCM10012275_34360 [Longimycelium tulufanense]
MTTLSGGEQKRLVLEASLRGPEQVLLLDEPDNYLYVPGKRWLEGSPSAPARACCWSAPVDRADRGVRPGVVFGDRYLLFRSDGRVMETEAPVWDEPRVQRAG